MTATLFRPTLPAPPLASSTAALYRSSSVSHTRLVNARVKQYQDILCLLTTFAVSELRYVYSRMGPSLICPNSNPSLSDIVRMGWASVKEDAFTSLFKFWICKWMVLTGKDSEQTSINLPHKQLEGPRHSYLFPIIQTNEHMH